MPARHDIPLQRNEDWSANFVLKSAGEPIDLTGMTVAMQVRDALNQALVASADVEIVDAVGGEINIELTASEGSPLSIYGSPIQVAYLFHDLRLTDTDGFNIVLFSGRLILSRGETVN